MAGEISLFGSKGSFNIGGKFSSEEWEKAEWDFQDADTILSSKRQIKLGNQLYKKYEIRSKEGIDLNFL